MTADQLQEIVDKCRWRTLQRNDGTYYRHLFEDCRNPSCRYSKIMPGLANKEGGGAGTFSAAQTPVTSYKSSSSSTQKASTQSADSVQRVNCQGFITRPGLEDNVAVGQAAVAPNPYADLHPDAAAANAALDDILASGFDPRAEAKRFWEQQAHHRRW